MARPSIPGHIIATRGKPIKLIDGSTATIVFTFSSLMTIEEVFGSIAHALAETRAGMTSAAFSSVARLAAAGLEHEEREGEQLSDVDVLRNLLDPMLFDDYGAAVGEAISAAFPDEVAKSDENEGGEGDADPRTASLGESGGTSPA